MDRILPTAQRKRNYLQTITRWRNIRRLHLGGPPEPLPLLLPIRKASTATGSTLARTFLPSARVTLSTSSSVIGEPSTHPLMNSCCVRLSLLNIFHAPFILKKLMGQETSLFSVRTKQSSQGSKSKQPPFCSCCGNKELH